MTKKEKDEYFGTIDWKTTSIAKAAKDAGISHAAAYARWKRSGAAVKPPRKHSWATVDWSQRTGDIAADLGVSPSAVSAARRKHAPETI